jgi:hypothetical protein
MKKPTRIILASAGGVTALLIGVGIGAAGSSTTMTPAANPAPAPATSVPASHSFKDQNGYHCQSSEVVIRDGFNYCPADPDAYPATPSEAPSQEPLPSNYNAPVGSTMTVTDDSDGSKYTVTVNSIKTYNPGEYDEAAGSGYHYIVANVTYKAISGTASPNTWDWKSKDKSGQSIDAASIYPDTALSSDDIAAGQTARGDIVFKVPNVKYDRTIVYSPGLSEAGSWQVPSFA